MRNFEFIYQDLLNNIEKGESFSFSRWGDGEVNAFLGTDKPHNCDGHKYFKDMGEELGKILKSEPDYICGIQPLAMRVRGDEIRNFCKGLDIKWCCSDIIHRSNIKGNLNKLFNVLNNSKNYITFVAPGFLKAINKYIKYDSFIEVPKKNCWLEKDRILSLLFKAGESVKMNKSKNNIFLFCSGMPTNYFIDQMYNKFGNVFQLIDIGSALDPYCGKNTRGYHKDLKIKK